MSAGKLPRNIFTQARILLIEDSFESRSLFKSYIKSFGIHDITGSENGSELLVANKRLNYDLIILGYGLGNCHSGLELIQTLTDRKLLPDWSKVLFITNSDSITTAGHPFRLIKCEVIRKPINPRTLAQTLIRSISSVHFFKDVLEMFEQGYYQQLDDRLDQLHSSLGGGSQMDEWYAIKIQIQLKLGHGNQAWQLAHSISDEVFRACNRLAMSNALGDARKLTLSSKMQTANSTMQKRTAMYQVQRFLHSGSDKEALELLLALPRHRLSVQETDLVAALLVRVKGLDAAIEFLSARLGTSLDNHYFRNSVTFSMVQCYLVSLMAEPGLAAEMTETVDTVSRLIRQTDWGQSSVNYADQILYLRMVLELLTHPQEKASKDSFKRLAGIKQSRSFLQWIMLAMGAYLCGDKSFMRECLIHADELTQALEITASNLSEQLMFRRVFDTCFSEAERAREFNRVGIHNTNENKPYPALRMFYYSHLCAPKHPSIAINLLDTLIDMGLERFWQVDQSSLAASISEMSLRDNEQRKFDEIKRRLPAKVLKAG